MVKITFRFFVMCVTLLLAACRPPQDPQDTAADSASAAEDLIATVTADDLDARGLAWDHHSGASVNVGVVMSNTVASTHPDLILFQFVKQDSTVLVVPYADQADSSAVLHSRCVDRLTCSWKFKAPPKGQSYGLVVVDVDPLITEFVLAQIFIGGTDPTEGAEIETEIKSWLKKNKVEQAPRDSVPWPLQADPRGACILEPCESDGELNFGTLELTIRRPEQQSNAPLPGMSDAVRR